MASRTMTHMQSQPASRLHLLCFILLVVGRTYGQHMNAPDAPCQSPASNAEMTSCFIQTSKAADERLNKTYSRIREVLSPDEQHDLQNAQRLWLKFRDTNCSAERNLYAGGSAGPTVYAACIEADARKRTSDLKMMYGWRLEKHGKSIE
jgi:uncharacterized protein YecT (DUF1311 family)